MEQNLFEMFKHFNLGTGMTPDAMFKLLEQAMWEMISKAAEMRLAELQGKGTAGATKAGVGFDESMNPFTILGVNLMSSEDEVKVAYRKKAWDAHPDHGGTNEQMAKVNAAFEVICRFKGWKK